MWCVTGLLSQSSGSGGSGLSPGDQLAELVKASGPTSGSPLSSAPSPGCFSPLSVLTDGALVPKCHTPTSPTGIADCHCQRLLSGTSGGRGGCIFTAPASPRPSPETRAPYPPRALWGHGEEDLILRRCSAHTHCRVRSTAAFPPSELLRCPGRPPRQAASTLPDAGV